MTEVLARSISTPSAATCPDWCTVSTEDHARDLWDNGGHRLHHSDTISVPDLSGYFGHLEEPSFHRASSVDFMTITGPDNEQTRPAVIYVNGRPHSVEQALALADEIRRQVELYR